MIRRIVDYSPNAGLDGAELPLDDRRIHHRPVDPAVPVERVRHAARTAERAGRPVGRLHARVGDHQPAAGLQLRRRCRPSARSAPCSTSSTEPLRPTPSRCRPAPTSPTASSASTRPKSSSASRSKGTRTHRCDTGTSRPGVSAAAPDATAVAGAARRAGEAEQKMTDRETKEDPEVTATRGRRRGQARCSRRARRERHMCRACIHDAHGMLLFIGSEMMFFAALFGAYFNPAPRPWPRPAWPPEGTRELHHARSPIPLIATIILVRSSFTMQWAVWRIRKGDRTGMNRALALTLLMGVIFLLPAGVRLPDTRHPGRTSASTAASTARSSSR